MHKNIKNADIFQFYFEKHSAALINYYVQLATVKRQINLKHFHGCLCRHLFETAKPNIIKSLIQTNSKYLLVRPTYYKHSQIKIY